MEGNGGKSWREMEENHGGKMEQKHVELENPAVALHRSIFISNVVNSHR